MGALTNIWIGQRSTTKSGISFILYLGVLVSLPRQRLAKFKPIREISMYQGMKKEPPNDSKSTCNNIDEI